MFPLESIVIKLCDAGIVGKVSVMFAAIALGGARVRYFEFATLFPSRIEAPWMLAGVFVAESTTRTEDMKLALAVPFVIPLDVALTVPPEVIRTTFPAPSFT